MGLGRTFQQTHSLRLVRARRELIVSQVRPNPHLQPRGRRQLTQEAILALRDTNEALTLAKRVHADDVRAADYRLLGEVLWSRFSVGRRDQLWYYRRLVEEIAAPRPPGSLLGLLDAQVTEIEALVATAR